MVREIKAKCIKGKIKPLEEIDLKEGEEVIVLLLDRDNGEGMIKAIRTTAGAWNGAYDPEELKHNIYADRLSGNRPEPKL